jgi:hypothetical protein
VDDQLVNLVTGSYEDIKLFSTVGCVPTNGGVQLLCQNNKRTFSAHITGGNV